MCNRIAVELVKICPHCGDHFTSEGMVYCSDDCFQESNAMRDNASSSAACLLTYPPMAGCWAGLGVG